MARDTEYQADFQDQIRRMEHKSYEDKARENYLSFKDRLRYKEDRGRRSWLYLYGEPVEKRTWDVQMQDSEHLWWKIGEVEASTEEEAIRLASVNRTKFTLRVFDPASA